MELVDPSAYYWPFKLIVIAIAAPLCLLLRAIDIARTNKRVAANSQKSSA